MFPDTSVGPLLLKGWVSFPGRLCPVASEILEADNATETVIVRPLGSTRCEMVRFWQVSQVALVHAHDHTTVQYFGSPRRIPAVAAVPALVEA